MNNFLVDRIAILDEPSSGLDPESRRELWNILLDMRKDHTIFITTHYMEEAEALADKIAIISHGQLLCYGPSIQLKRRFETGYILKLLTNDRFKQVAVMDTIREFVPDVILKVNWPHKNGLNLFTPTCKLNSNRFSFCHSRSHSFDRHWRSCCRINIRRISADFCTYWKRIKRNSALHRSVSRIHRWKMFSWSKSHDRIFHSSVERNPGDFTL